MKINFKLNTHKAEKTTLKINDSDFVMTRIEQIADGTETIKCLSFVDAKGVQVEIQTIIKWK